MISIQEFLKNAQVGQYKAIAIYGFGDTEQEILEELKKYHIKRICLTDRIESGRIGKVSGGFLIQKLDDIVNDIDAVIIASRNFHMTIEVRLMREIKDKNIKILNPFRMISRYPTDQLIINNYVQDCTGYQNEEEIANWRQKNIMLSKERINAFVTEAMQETPLFNRVEIETYNKCNGICSFCPVNKYNDTRKQIGRAHV